MTSVTFWMWISAIGAGACAAAYLYAYVVRSRGARPLHTAGLLFSGLALANLPMMLAASGRSGASLNEILLVGCLLIGAVCQAVTALRRRSGDARAAVGSRQEDRRLQDRRQAPPAGEATGVAEAVPTIGR